MKRIWFYASNVFLNVTSKSYVLAMRISTYHDNALLVRIADPAIAALYALYHPKHLAFKAKYDVWLSQGGMLKGQTLNLTQLLSLLSKSKIEAFDVAIRNVYAKTTPRYEELFPRGRKTFQQGKQLERIMAVQTLISTIGADAALATVKAEIQNFYDLLDEANNTQKGSKSQLKGNADTLESTRANMCIAQYYSLGALMQIYAEKPSDLEAYFDLEAIRNHKQLIFSSHLAPGAQENLLEHTFGAGDTFVVSADQNIKLYLSNSPTVITGAFVEVFAGITKTVNVDEFGVDLTTHKYLIVINQSLVAPVNYNVQLM